MKRKPRDYSHEYKPIEPDNITISELYGLGMDEMNRRANGTKKAKVLNEQKQIITSGNEIRVRQIIPTDKKGN
ncbi:MAG: hypothetical protein JWR59_2522 [Brevundimonas sp.]|nr:hypothetical protein [Brevundimonas sp.]